MRKWFKYLVVDDIDECRDALLDKTFEQHSRTMAYERLDDCVSCEDFFAKTYFDGSHVRFREYDSILRLLLTKRRKTLFIGSGHCVNEGMLARDGYDITCSDLEKPQSAKNVFPSIAFVKYDLSSGPFLFGVFDCIVSLSVFYSFDEDRLGVALRNVKASLNPGGRLVVDVGGGADTWLTFFIDEVLCKYEGYIKWFIRKYAQGDRCVVIRKHHGYRYADKDFISMVTGQGFKFVKIFRADFATELERISLLRRLARLSGFFKTPLTFAGRSAPYIRAFVFEKEG